MPNFKRATQIGGLFVVLFIVFGSSKVFAASNAGSVLTTSPVSVDLSASPGTSVSTTLQVQNNTDSSALINVRVEEFKAQGDDGAAQIFPAPSGDPSINWVHLSRTSFTASPDVWEPVTMEINLPKTAAYGYYYAVLFSLSTPKQQSSTTNVIKSANAILVLLDAHASGENNKLEVQSFTSEKISYQYLPASFSINVKNVGNVFTIPEGDIYISRTMNGKPIDTIDINSGQGNVLPGTNRVFQAEWSDGFPLFQTKRIDGKIVSNSKGQPVESIKWNLNQLTKFRFGKYYAHLVLVYTSGGRDIPINATVSFWVIPWFLLAVFVVIIILVVLGLWTLSRPLRSRISRRLKGRQVKDSDKLAIEKNEQKSAKK